MNDENVEHPRRIKSFVLRTGRLTEGQEKALERQWPLMGLQLSDGLLDFSQVFQQQGPIVFEIGFGTGTSLVEMAKNSPEKNFIGVEVHTPGVGRCLNDAERLELSNLKVFEEDAIEVIKQCIPDGSLDTVQIFFPDPWHKTKHTKRRLVKAEFIALLTPKLKQGGVIHMATDWKDYAKQMLRVMGAEKNYENLAEEDYYPRPEWRPLTKFEKRGEGLGHGVWDLLFKKR